MKTEYQIHLDYNQAMRQADKLDELAAELEQVGGTKLGEALGQVRANWSGENADAFLRKANVLTTQNGKNVKKLRSIASTIRTVATNTYNADLRALRIAQERGYL